MNRYKILHRKPLESMNRFEQRINEECARDWKVINMTGYPSGLAVILERENRH